VHAFHVRAEIRVRPEPSEKLRHLADERDLDVGAGEVVPDDELPAGERPLDVVEVIRELLVDALLERCGDVTAHPSRVEQQQQRHGRGSLGVVEPVHVLVVERRSRVGLQPALRVVADHVVDDCAGFRDGDVAISDHR